jgi:tRNA 2-thiouridine synthesizing protein D
MAKLTIGCFSSLVGSMSLDFAVKLAEAAIATGHEVDFWMSGNAVMLSKQGQKSFKDYSYLDKRPRRDGQGDEHVRLRGLRRGARLPQGGHVDHPKFIRKSMDWYLASCHTADRVLHIGGE